LDRRPTAGSLLEQDLHDFINETSRNYQVWLTLAHVDLTQLSPTIRDDVMSLGTQIIGSVGHETALELSRRYDRFDAHRTKRHRPIYGRNDLVIDYEPVDMSLEEQRELNSYPHMDRPRYEFGIAVAESEGRPGRRLRRMSIANINAGIFVDEPMVAETRDRLLRLRGQRVGDILQEIESRQSPALPAPQMVRTPPAQRIGTRRTQ
jgi:hypothetical protein